MIDCLFCKIIKGEIKSEIIFEDEHCLAFKDINPVAPHHYLVIPKKHLTSIIELDAQTSAAIVNSLQELAKKYQVENFRTVFNTGAQAGQSVFHVHAHFIAGRALEWPPG